MDVKKKIQKVLGMGFDYTGSIQDVIDNLKKVQDEYGQEYENITVELDTCTDYYDSTETTIVVQGFREETDDEFTARLVKESKAKALSESSEKQLFKRLLKKYGSNI